ncbi:MAG: hypothetical protein ACTSQ8_24125, partial [Candidatus Helarchaeota archaeon]
FADSLFLRNADGLYIRFLMPSLFYTENPHTTIEKMTVYLHSVAGQSFARVYYDYDFRKYILDSSYSREIPGLGKMTEIPLYIPLRNFIMSNPSAIFDLRLLDGISIEITDSSLWPGDFINEDNVLNLPYQRVGIADIILFNVLNDDIREDKEGYINSEIKVEAIDHYNFYGIGEIRVKRIQNYLQGAISYYYENNEGSLMPLISGVTADIEYSDYIYTYLRFDTYPNPLILNEFTDINIYLADNSTDEILSIGRLNWLDEPFYSNPEPSMINYYFAKLKVPQKLGHYTVKLCSDGSYLHDLIIENGVISFNVICYLV